MRIVTQRERTRAWIEVQKELIVGSSFLVTILCEKKLYIELMGVLCAVKSVLATSVGII